MEKADILKTLGAMPTATIFEAAGKLGDMSARIRPIVPGVRLAGVAWTVKAWLADTTPVIRALDEAPPGSVLVIDVGDTDAATIWGGTSSLVCRTRGLAGCVTNGAVRDTEEMVAIGVPVYAAGIAPRGAVKSHPGWTNIPVAVGGVPVMPGDYVFGDADGVVVVPHARGAEVAAAALLQREREEVRDARVRRGDSLAQIIGLAGART